MKKLFEFCKFYEEFLSPKADIFYTASGSKGSESYFVLIDEICNLPTHYLYCQ